MKIYVVVVKVVITAFHFEDLGMKIKLVKFEDLDCSGRSCEDYGLTLGCEYEVVKYLGALCLAVIVNNVNEEVAVYKGEYEVVND